MNKTNESDGVLNLSLDPSARKRGRRFIWMLLAIVLLIGSSWMYLLWTAFDPGRDEIAHTIFPTLIVFIFPLAWGFLAYIARCLGWYGCRYRITPKAIEWIFPDGRVFIGHWTDLKYVSAGTRLLYFADGVKIPLQFGPGRYGEISKHGMRSLIAMSGDESILARAFGEIGSIAVPNRKRFDQTWLLLTSLVLFLGPMLVTAILTLNGVSMVIAIGSGAALFACPIGFLALKHLIKTRIVEKKFGPPKGYPNVKWHRQF